MPRTIGVQERRARLARRHLLLPSERAEGPQAVATVADALVALHSTDPVSVYLSAAARMREPSLGAVEAALYDERSVVRHHAMRRTLWVATPDVVRLMHASASRKLAGAEHRRTAKLLAENGVEDPEAWLADAREQVLAALDEHGPMTARSLGRLVPALRHPIVLAPGKSWEQTVSAHTRVLLGLGFEGRIVRTRPTGTWVNGAYTYTDAHRWLDGGLDDGSTVREAAAELALRWLRAFGPATTADLQWWNGWTVALTRDALADCGAVEVTLEDGPGWVAPGDEAEEPPVPAWVALLPSLDPTTMGWKVRDWYLPESARGIFDRSGNGGPTVWMDGQVVGGWSQGPDGTVHTRLFVEPTAAQAAALAERVESLSQTVGDTRFTVRFEGPVSSELARMAKHAALG